MVTVPCHCLPQTLCLALVLRKHALLAPRYSCTLLRWDQKRYIWVRVWGVRVGTMRVGLWEGVGVFRLWLRECESVTVWRCDCVWGWVCNNMEMWLCECESVTTWICNCVSVSLWQCEDVTVCEGESVTTWRCDYVSVSLWPHEYVIVWVWVCDCVKMWLCVRVSL